MATPTDKEIADGINLFIERMSKLTVHLTQLRDNQPINGGSGFIYEHGDKHTLFTVLHCFQPNKKVNPNDISFDGWYLETGIVVGNRTLAFTLPPAQFVTQMTIADPSNIKAHHVDFAWGQLDVGALREKMKQDPKLSGIKVELPIYRGRIDHRPDSVHGYGFAAYATSEWLPQSRQLVRDPIAEIAMLFDGYDDRGLCRFKLDGKHKGHAAYWGSSGAPIADDEGHIVALVSCGPEEQDAMQDVIYGTPLHGYGRLIEIPNQ
ncbi:MAG TPA: hypothetical protein VG326_17335 [Tepidisphaeraceae bacterium]|jgi:hypothetical protein|nr:hypothetical protein [Tepidisphaeraceae bacterium]